MQTRLLLLLWGVSYILPWDKVLSFSPFLQITIAYLLVSVPGVCLYTYLYRDRGITLAESWAISFGITSAIFPLLLMAFKFLQVPAFFLSASMFLVGVLSLPLLRLPQIDFRNIPNLYNILSILFVVFCSFLIMDRHSFASDYEVYTAYTTHFADADVLNTNEIFFGTDNSLSLRHLAISWYAVPAILRQISGLNAYEIYHYLTFYLSTVMFSAVWLLARQLGLSSKQRFFAIVAHAAAYALLLGPDQPGFRAFNALVDDKNIVAFILAPLLAVMFMVYLESQRKADGALLVFIGWGLAMTHVTMTAIACMILGLFLLLHCFPHYRSRLFLTSVGLLVLIMLLPLPLRLIPQDKFDFDVANGINEFQAQRLWVSGDGRLFAVKPSLVADGTYYLTASIVFFALLRMRRGNLEKYVLAVAGIFLLVANPLTARLVALMITPYHLWRVTWFVPFGIILAYGYKLLWERADGSFFEKLTYGFAIIAMVVTFPNLLPHGDSDEIVEQFSSLEDVVLQHNLDESSIWVGSGRINHFLPAIDPNVNIITMKWPDQVYGASRGFSVEESHQRWEDLNYLRLTNYTSPQKLQLLVDYDVRYLVDSTNRSFFGDLVTAYPSFFHRTIATDRYVVYEFSPLQNDILQSWSPCFDIVYTAQDICNAYLDQRHISLPTSARVFAPEPEWQIDELLQEIDRIYIPQNEQPIIGSISRATVDETLAALTTWDVVFNQLSFEADLDLTQTETDLVNRWRSTKEPELLTFLGIDYLLVSHLWINYLTEQEYAPFRDSSGYALVDTVMFGSTQFSLYEVRSE